MSPSRTSQGDPARTLALLWRERDEAGAGDRPRKGPRQRLSVDAVVAAAIALADESGLEALTMRAIAARLAVSPMSIYTYVPGKAELLDLMVDSVYLAMERPRHHGNSRWRRRVRAIADQNRALLQQHPWVARVSTTRPPLGPGMMAKYEYELEPFAGLGLGDVEMDAALTYLLSFVQAATIAAQEAERQVGESGLDDTGWWRQVGPLLGRFLTADAYPLAARVGTAAGKQHGSAHDPESAYSFGIERVLDGLGVLIEAIGPESERTRLRR